MSDASEPEVVVAATPGDRGRVRRALLLGARMFTGVVGVGAAVLTIAVVGLVPLPRHDIAVPAVRVVPTPADMVRVCPGATLRLGEESGQNAGVPVAVGEPEVVASGGDTDVQDAPLPESEAGSGGTAAAPRVLSVAPGDDALLGGAQSQDVDARDLVGFAAAACTEPTGSAWLVGGATTVGRAAVLMLANPTAVAATVDLTIYGETGLIAAPGLSGIEVPPGTQRALSLAGYAPGLAAPVVHVEARGGRVVATVQHSVVRGLAASGVEIVGATPPPARHLTIPGVRVLDSVGVNRALALADWEDVAPVLRVLVPGDEPAALRISVVPIDPEHEGASFELEVDAGRVTEVPLDAGETSTGHGLEDGIYTVTVESDVPVVAAARVSTAVDSGVDPAPDAVIDAPASDLAWFVPAEPLGGDALVAVAPGHDAFLSAVNPTDAEVTLELSSGDGEPRELVIPAGGSAAIRMASGDPVEVRGAEGVVLAIVYASPGRLSSYVVAPPRPVAGPLLVHPG
jgi:hypothetical protein